MADVERPTPRGADAAEAERERAEAEAAAEAEAEARGGADDETGTKSGRGQNLRREKPLHPRPFEWPAAPAARSSAATRGGSATSASRSSPTRGTNPPRGPRLGSTCGTSTANRTRRRGASTRDPAAPRSRSPARTPRARSRRIPRACTCTATTSSPRKAAHAEAEKAAWRAKVVVDDARMALELPIRKRSSALDKTRSMLADEPRKLGVTGRFTRGMPTGPGGVISMFLDEPPMETRGLSLDETFNRSLRADTTERRAAFTAGPGRDFKRVGVGSRSLVHTKRVAEVGKSGRVRTKSG